jgi:hypothetical protein
VGRSIYFAFRDLKWYARPVTLRIQGTHLVRFRL